MCVSCAGYHSSYTDISYMHQNLIMLFLLTFHTVILLRSHRINRRLVLNPPLNRQIIQALVPSQRRSHL